MAISVRQKKISEQVKRLIIEQLMFELLIDNPIKTYKIMYNYYRFPTIP